MASEGNETTEGVTMSITFSHMQGYADVFEVIYKKVES